MFSFLKRGARTEKREPAPEWAGVKGGTEFPLAQNMARHEGYPVVDWAKVLAWTDTLDTETRKAAAWAACERAWLLHFRDALSAAFRLDESESAAVVSSLEPGVGRATVQFIERTGRRIGADSGEFAISGGMHLNAGCGHFVTVKGELRVMEATIVHEMTHAWLGHLPLPAWLNEGLAVNTEQRLAGVPRATYGAVEQLHDQLRRYWSVVSIQAFWSGQAFHAPESQQLSYELARILVEQLAKDWSAFAQFARSADRADAGAAAAREHLGLDLGHAVTALLERDTPRSWSPDPSKWEKP